MARRARRRGARPRLPGRAVVHRRTARHGSPPPRRGFVYAASTMGVTGARDQRRRGGRGPWSRATKRHRRCRSRSGSGVSTGEQAAEVAAYADGVIVGSAFVRRLLDAADADRRHGGRRRPRGRARRAASAGG